MSDRWWNVVRGFLAQRGITLDSSGRYSLDPTYSGTDAPSQTLLDTMNAAAPFRNVHPRQQLNWVRDFDHTIERLMAANSSDPAALECVFWIRLHGILVDIDGSFDPVRQLCGDMKRTPGSLLASAQPVMDEIAAVRRALSEGELLWAEHSRHAEAHVFQRSYEPQWNKKKTMARDTFTSKFTGQSYDVDVLHDMLREVRGKYDTEQEIVVDFARRVRPTARRLHQAMIPFCGGT